MHSTELQQSDIERQLIQLGEPSIAKQSQRFFKTAKGEYGEGDVFLGIRVPVLRKQVKQLKQLPFTHTKGLLHSSYHEIRLFALLHMVQCYNKADDILKEEIYQYYLSNTAYVNNWDLVDSSAHLIVGAHLSKRKRKVLYQLSRSTLLWDRRIAMISCFYFIKQNDFEDALAIAKQLLQDEHDLIHKSVGWMLREIGKRNKAREQSFLNQHYQQMPRTMLRYAIEKFSPQERQAYLKGLI